MTGPMLLLVAFMLGLQAACIYGGYWFLLGPVRATVTAARAPDCVRCAQTLCTDCEQYAADADPWYWTKGRE